MDIRDAVFVYQMKSQNELLWHGRVHAHEPDMWEIHYFLGGNGVFVNDSTRYAITPGSLFVSSPRIVHAISATAREAVTYYAILIHLEERDDELRRLLEENLGDGPFRVGTNYRFFFEEVKEKSLSGDHNRHQSACHQMASLLYQIAAGDRGPARNQESHHLEKALRIMHREVFSTLSLEELASAVNLSPSYLVRLFRFRMNQTPMRYYMKLKIEAASAMLTCTEESVKAISERLSFSSEFHFSRQFKAHTDLSPTLYRKNYLQKIES